MTTKQPLSTFEVDKAGLAKLLERRGGKAFAIAELIQNAWDEDVTTVTVDLAANNGRNRYELTVEDDCPTGFADLSHAYTLFAESAKKADPTKRGRFNLGEKFVIAICEHASIETTTGTVTFDGDGRRHGRAVRERGSRFRGTLRMTAAEATEALRLVRTLIPPADVTTVVNGEPLEQRTPHTTFRASLQTEWADEDGNLHRNHRQTDVQLHAVRDGERASIYEMGIPVVETGDEWHVNVMQKVPLNMDRDNVTPAYLRAVRAEVLNHAVDLLPDDSAGHAWVTAALSDERITAEAINATLDARYGEKRVVHDPSDPESNKRAVAAGYAVIPPRSLPRGLSARAREMGVLERAGAVTPSPRPYADGETARETEPPERWTPEMRATVDYAVALGERLLGRTVDVEIVNDPNCWTFSATYRPGHLEFNLRTLGRRWFTGPTETVNALLIHEFAHEYSSDHLSDGFHDACCKLGARLAALALSDPGFFADWRAEVSA